MRRIFFATVLIVALVAAFVAGSYAATKTYQFTGVVKSDDGGTFSVEKNAKETWTFEKDGSTKGTAKVGDKVTVEYKMVATRIESKPPTTTPAKKK